MLDQDTRAVTEALDAAQARSGLGKAEFARALGTSPSRYSTYRTGKVAPTAAFLARARRIAGVLARANEQGVPSSTQAAQAIRRARQERGDLWAFTLALEARDRLADIIERRPELADAWEAKPTTGDDRWDTLFAAIVAHTFAEYDRPAPKWSEGRKLAEAWMPVESIRYRPAEAKEHTPDWLAERNIFVAARDLATA